MKQPITLRVDPHLLNAAKQAATLENRTLTNFIETLLRAHLGVPNVERVRAGGRKEAVEACPCGHTGHSGGCGAENE